MLRRPIIKNHTYLKSPGSRTAKVPIMVYCPEVLTEWFLPHSTTNRSWLRRGRKARVLVGSRGSLWETLQQMSTYRRDHTQKLVNKNLGAQLTPLWTPTSRAWRGFTSTFFFQPTEPHSSLAGVVITSCYWSKASSLARPDPPVVDHLIIISLGGKNSCCFHQSTQ